MLKADIVETDEKEKNLRMVLNFGHSVGHAIEQISNYKIMHGYAVALGILVEAKIAVLLGLLANEDYIQIVSLLSKLGITKEQLHQFKVVDIVSKMLGDKKNIAGDIYMILLNKIGDIKLSTDNKVVHRVSNEIITKAFASLV
jgi:3-dehydroquinate synthase